MKKPLVQRIALAAALSGLVLGSVHAQQHAEHQRAPAKPAAAAEPQEVFCSTMKTGQLCSHGTTTALGLTPQKQDAWMAAVRRYNKAVNDATVQLQAEAKTTLTPAQLAEVERWFSVGMNPQINQLLAAPAKAASAKGGPK